MKKKILALLLVVCLLVGFAACKKEEKAPEDTTPIKVGCIQDITGATSTLGNMVYQGALYAVNEINEAGGINGRQIELVVYDTAASTDEAINGYTKAVTEDNVCAIIGPPVGNIAHALKTFSEDYEVPILCFAGDLTVYVKEDGTTYKNMFLFQPDLYTNAHIMYNWATTDGALSTFGVLYNESNSYSVTIANTFLEDANKNGTTITDTVVFNADSTDFVTLMTKVTANNPDAVFAPCYTAKNIQIVQAAEQIGYTGKIIMGLDACPPFEEKAGLEDLSNCIYVNNVDDTDQKIIDISADILASDNIEVTNKFFMGYDVVYVLKQIIGEVGDDSAAIRTALESLTGFEGLTGTLTINPETHAVTGLSMVIGTYEGTTSKPLGRYTAE